MGEQNTVNLYDRVKELTYTQGTINFALAGAADGFSEIGRFYDHNDVLFYAVTDGQRYEVGSGVYKRSDFDPNDSITYNELERHPFRSSNPDNSKVNFPPGVKEVYVTYPATHSVMMGSGLPNLNVPQRKGIAVWDSENILNYFPNLIFDNALSALGINNEFPLYGIDLGGDSEEYSSRVRASGYYVGPVGAYFQENNGGNAELNLSKVPYAGGTQYVHFVPNQTDQFLTSENQTNSHLVIQVSGDVNQYILLKKQSAHTVFAGPVDDCEPSCAEEYPTFRNLVIDDIPDLSSLYSSFASIVALSGYLVDYTNTAVAATGDLLTGSISGVLDQVNIYTSGYQNDFIDFETAISGQINNFINYASGILFPYDGVFNKTLPSINANSVHPEAFNISGIVATDKYSISMSPSTALQDNLLLTYAFVADDNKVSGIFYAPQQFNGQNLDFHITVHKINNVD